MIKRAWSDPEGRLQTYCAKYLTQFFPPPGTWQANEAGVKLAGTKQQRVNAWARLKAKGVKPGVEDISANYMGLVMAFELKAKSKLSDAQEKRGREIVANGGRYFVIRSVEDLHTALLISRVPVNLLSLALATAQGYDRILSTPKPSRKPSTPKPKAERPSKKAQAFAAKVYGA